MILLQNQHSFQTRFALLRIMLVAVFLLGQILPTLTTPCAAATPSDSLTIAGLMVLLIQTSDRINEAIETADKYEGTLQEKPSIASMGSTGILNVSALMLMRDMNLPARWGSPDVFSSPTVSLSDILQELQTNLNETLKVLSQTYQENLNVTIGSLDDAVSRNLFKLAEEIEDINEMLMEDIGTIAELYSAKLQETSLTIKDIAIELENSLKNVLVFTAKTAVYVLDRAIYNAVLVIAVVLLGLGLLLFTRLLISKGLPSGTLARTLVLLFMAAFLALFGALALIPPVRGYAMAYTGIGLQQRLEEVADRPRVVAVVPSTIVVGETTEVEIWGTSLRPQDQSPTVVIVSGSETVGAAVNASNDKVVAVQVPDLSGFEGSVNLILRYSDPEKEARGVVKIVTPVPTPAPPDLVVTKFSIAPKSPKVGDNVEATITVENKGAGPAKKFVVRWNLTGDRCVDKSVLPAGGEKVTLKAGEKVTLKIGGSYYKDGEFISMVEVDPDNKVGEAPKDRANNSKSKDVTVQPQERPWVTYQVTVITGDVSGGGTNANIYLTLEGKYGEITDRLLDTKGENEFEAGDTDTFWLTSRDIGDITKGEIYHDDSGWKPGWYLEKVKVQNTDTNQVWEFQCSKWLAKDEGDKKIKRTLWPNKKCE